MEMAFYTILMIASLAGISAAFAALGGAPRKTRRH